MVRRTVSLVAALGVLALIAAACGDDDDGTAAGGDEGGGDEGGGDVTVVLSEWIVEPDPTSASAGEITFVADNQGGETHELVVVAADTADDLPVDDEGAFDEQAFGEQNVLGEVEDVESGTTKDLTLDLEPGDYVLLCNIVEEPGEMDMEEMEPGEEPHRHFAEGMHTEFTVS